MLLLAVKSCEQDARSGFHQIIRNTWGRDVQGPDLKFFVGRGRMQLQPDEVRVDCQDDYMSLPQKTKAICRWTLERDCDFMFLCDTDTYVIPDRLLSSRFEHYDLTGHFNGPIGVPDAREGKYWAWISGGNGYWLSRRAAQIVADAPDDGEWAEDRMVGQVLGPYFHRGELKAFHHDGYEYARSGDGSNEWITRVTSHFCVGNSKRRAHLPEWMHSKYAYNVGRIA